MEKTNEILTIAGKRVRVAYTGAANHCDRCCIKPRCRKYIRERCRDYDDPNSPLHAIFVPAEESGERDIREKAEIIKAIIEAKGFRYTHDEMMRMTKKELLEYYKEIEGTSQEVTLIPSNEDADKAATDYYLSLTNSSYGEGGHLLPRSINEAFKAGIAYERERIIKMVETAGARFMQRVDIVPEDESSLKLSMYCTELVEQIKSQSNS